MEFEQCGCDRMSAEAPEVKGAKLSVVVAAYNVDEYLRACLESVARQTLSDLEVIVVDDGSSDSTGRIADAFSERYGWLCVHVPNGGLGRARNIGMDKATGEYLVFLDGDDLVPPDAYQLMVHALEESGSDLVAGGALRYDGTQAVPSPLHRQAIRGAQLRTHIKQRRELIYDTTAWNKTYRRSFLLRHDLRFPEGVLYEDIPVTLPAHFLAEAVDVLDDPVYLWRERQTANASITQRRGETTNLKDRIHALVSVRDFLVRRNDKYGLRIFDEKALKTDIPLYIDSIHASEADFLDVLVELVSTYLEDVDPRIVRKLPPIRRLEYFLIAQGHGDELREVQNYYRLPSNRDQYRRVGRKLIAELPYRDDPRLRVPPSVYDASRSQPLITGLREISWRGSSLVLDGHAYIHAVPMATPISMLRRVQLVRQGTDGLIEKRRSVPSWPTRRTDISARVGRANYDFSGFRAKIPPSMLRLKSHEQAARYEVVVQVATWWAQRGSRLGHPDTAQARQPSRRLLGPDQLVVPAMDDEHLYIDVRRILGTLTDCFSRDGVAVLLLIEATPGSLRNRRLYLKRSDSIHQVSIDLDPVAEMLYEARVTADLLGEPPVQSAERIWEVGILGRGATRAATPDQSLDAHPDFRGRSLKLPHRQLLIEQRGSPGVTISDTRQRFVLTHFAADGHEVVLSGVGASAATSTLTLTHTSGAQWELPIQVEGPYWRVKIPTHEPPGTPSIRWMRPGLTRFEVGTPDPFQRHTPARVLVSAEMQMADWTALDGVKYRLKTTYNHELLLEVDAGGKWSERAPNRRERARKYRYRADRYRPLEDTIVLEAWKGRQFSGNPAAIFEELQRRQDGRRVIVVVQHHGIEVPDAVERVVVGSPSYYRALATSRWVISNDSMPRHFVKRSGSRYAQTWHGTPLKRLGFDIADLAMANKNYLTDFSADVRKWDMLISPNSFSSEIFKRAFRYSGEIAEIGYPRNDIHYQPVERSKRAARARRRLGLPDGKKVILYAPTWRDDRYDTTGRYLFQRSLDLELLHQHVGDDSVLLLRGHQLVAESVGPNMLHGFVRNVSYYPDITDLYLVADVLITDYSSAMFDFVNTGRPVLYHAPDLEDYRDRLRGFYFDIENEGPGPFFGSTRQLAEALGDLPAVEREYADRYAVFRNRFSRLEDGGASRRFIEQFLS